jgi:hypothetical protein
MSAGKRRRQEPIRGSSDSEEEGDSMYDLNWEPEGGSVFKVPPYEFYNTKSEIPGRSKGAHDWLDDGVTRWHAARDEALQQGVGGLAIRHQE